MSSLLDRISKEIPNATHDAAAAGDTALAKSLLKKLDILSGIPDSPSKSSMVNICLSRLVESGPMRGIGLFYADIGKPPRIDIMSSGMRGNGAKRLSKAFGAASEEYASHGSRFKPCLIFKAFGAHYIFMEHGAHPLKPISEIVEARGKPCAYISLFDDSGRAFTMAPLFALGLVRGSGAL